jgi:hypothetical protein
MRTSNIKLNITVKTPKHRFCVFNTEVTKVLTKVAKVSGCEAVTEWIKSCTNHLYWSAITTHDGNGEVIWDKFSSFLSHVVDEHENLDNPLFNKCGHREIIEPRKWLDKGTAPAHILY